MNKHRNIGKYFNYRFCSGPILGGYNTVSPNVDRRTARIVRIIESNAQELYTAVGYRKFEVSILRNQVAFNMNKNTGMFLALFCSIASCVVGATIGVSVPHPRGQVWWQHGGGGLSALPIRVKDAMCQRDGVAYTSIAKHGYTYDQKRASSVAFFPVFPLLIAALGSLLQTDESTSALIISNVCFLASGFLFAEYLREQPKQRQISLTILAMSVFPTGFFFHMAYSESVFLCLLLLAMVGFKHRWHWFLLSLVAGLVTAARPVGIAAICYLPYEKCISSSFPRTVVKTAIMLSVASSGILAYMTFQWIEFDDPLAFAKTQHYYRMRPISTVDEKIFAYLSCEPIWSVYDSGSVAYWKRATSNPHLKWSLSGIDPIIWMSMGCLVLFGRWRGILTRREFGLGVLLLAVPYFTRGYDMCMMSQGRFASVCIPGYIVLGSLLASAPAFVRLIYFVVSTALLGLFSSLFARGFFLI